MATTILKLGKTTMIRFMSQLGFDPCVEEGTTDVYYTVACVNDQCPCSKVQGYQTEVPSMEVMVFENKIKRMYAAYCPYCKNIRFQIIKDVEYEDLLIILRRDKQDNINYTFVCKECYSTSNVTTPFEDDLMAVLPLNKETKKLIFNKTYICKKCDSVFVY